MSDVEPIQLAPRAQTSRAPSDPADQRPHAAQKRPARQVYFNRQELNLILSLYGRQVAAGEWRDYAIDMGAEAAVFSIFRKTSECPLFRIEKVPKLAKKQGAYRVVAATGLIMKRGSDLKRVISVLEKTVRLVE